MTAADLDALNAFLRAELARLERLRPGAARAGLHQGWSAAQGQFAAEVAGKTGLSAEFVRDQLAQRELVRQQATHAHEALRTVADSALISSLTAAAAWTLAAARPRAGKG